MTDDLKRKHYESPDLWSGGRFTAEVHRRIEETIRVITVPFCKDLLTGHVVCPACWCRFNTNYHLRSFDEAALQTLYDGYPQIRLKRLAGLIPERTRRLSRLWTILLLLRYDLLGAPDLAPHMQCPHYGYRKVSDSHVPRLTTAPRLGIAGLVERLWPKQSGYRCWISLYEKTWP